MFSFIRCATRCHSFYHSLPFVVTHCHLLSFIVSRSHSFSLVVTRFTTRCTTRCHPLSIVVTRCDSLSLDVPLVCLFMNDLSLVLTFSSVVLCLCMFHQPAKICLKSWMNNIQNLFLYLTDFCYDYWRLIPRHIKRLVPGDCKFFVKISSIWIKNKLGR